MGNICLSKSDTPIEYKTSLKQLSSAITDHPQEADLQILQLVTLTSQNTETSFNFQEMDDTQNKNASKQKTIQDFQIIRPLGKGAFGQVMLVKDKSSQKYYALKIIYKDTIKNHEQKLNALSQRYLLQALDFPFIVKLHYAFQSKTKLYLLVDFMSGGELFYLLRAQKVFEEEVGKFYAAQILLALEYLHNRNVIFRDLKPENVLLTKEGHVKLADFGLSKICFSRNQLAYSICGTPQYIAPEIILGKGYDKSADWFSFGSLLYDMLTGKPPFYSKNKHQILSNITSKQVPIPNDLSQEAQSLLRGLFKLKPKNRLGYQGAEEVKQHSFFKNVDFEKLKLLQIKPPISFTNCQLNNEGFDQINISITQTNLQQNNSQGKLAQDPFFKNFTYFKEQTYSMSNRESENAEGITPLNQRFNLNPLIMSQVIEQVKVKKDCDIEIPK